MKYKLVCFDLEGTLTDNQKSVWELVCEKLGTGIEKNRKNK
ncbi:hypothetical protein ACFLTH_14805 [Bacteroidota bacterium]